MSATTGLKIKRIHNQSEGAKNTNDEWVSLANEGTQQWGIVGWEITDQTARQQRVHIYTFPPLLAGGQTWRFDPGEYIFVFTGHGRDVFLPKSGDTPAQFHFYMNRDAFVWNNPGDRVYLRHADGTFATQPFPVPGATQRP